MEKSHKNENGGVMKFLLVMLSMVFLISCQSPTEDIVSHVMKNERYILDRFSNLTMVSRGNALVLIVHVGDEENKYFFDKNDSIYLVNPIEVFNIKEHDQFKNVLDINLVDFVAKLQEELEGLELKSFTSEFANHGIFLKINLPRHQELFYVPDLSMVKNPEWRKYINSSKKIKERWYLYDKSNP